MTGGVSFHVIGTPGDHGQATFNADRPERGPKAAPAAAPQVDTGRMADASHLLRREFQSSRTGPTRPQDHARQGQERKEEVSNGTLVRDGRTTIYARQRGIVMPTPAVLSPSDSVTVDRLVELGRKLGAPVTTKMKKAVLINVINKHNRQSVEIDPSKLTARQRRRIAKKGER